MEHHKKNASFRLCNYKKSLEITKMITFVKLLKVEKAGERIHQKWNMSTQTRFFSVRNGKEKLFLTFEEYENSLYIKK